MNKKSDSHYRLIWIVLGTLIGFGYWFFYCPLCYEWFFKSTNEAGSFFLVQLDQSRRGILYPLLIQSVKEFSWGSTFIMATQLAVYFSAVIYFTIQCHRLLKSFWLSTILLVLLSLYANVVKFSFLPWTESLVMSCLMLFLAFSIKAMLDKKYTDILFAAGILGFCIVLKLATRIWLLPFFLVVLYVLHDAKDHNQRSPYLFWLVPIVAWLLLNSLLYYIYTEKFRPDSMLGEMLFAKAALIIKNDTKMSNKWEKEVILNAISPINQLIEKSSDEQERHLLRYMYVDHVRYVKLGIPLMVEFNNLSRLLKEYRSMSNDIILSEPWSFIKMSLQEYAALWLFWDVVTPSEYNRLQTFLQKNPQSELLALDEWNKAKGEMFGTIEPVNAFFVFSIRLWFSFVFILGIFSWMVMIRNWTIKKPISIDWVCIGIVSIMIQLYFLQVAFANISAFRYCIMMWPAICMVGCLGLKRLKSLFTPS